MVLTTAPRSVHRSACRTCGVRPETAYGKGAEADHAEPRGEHDDHGGAGGEAHVVVHGRLEARRQPEPPEDQSPTRPPAAIAAGTERVTSRAVAAGVTTNATTSTVPTARTATTTVSATATFSTTSRTGTR